MPNAKNLVGGKPPQKPLPTKPAAAPQPKPAPKPVPRPVPMPVGRKVTVEAETVLEQAAQDVDQVASELIQSRPNASQTAALAKQAKAIALPAWLQQSSMPQTSDRQVGGFIGFAATQSNKWNEQQMAGLEDGQPYLFHEQRYIPLSTLDFFLLHGESFKTLMVGREGKFQWASRDLEEEGPTVGSNRPEPHYVCVCLVFAENRLIPIKGDFRGTKSGGMEGAIRAVEAAGHPEWAGMSDNHKMSCVFPQPFGRVFHSIRTQYKVSRTSGNPYFTATCVSRPATITQIQKLTEAFTDDEFIAALNECKANFDQRIAFLDRIIEHGPDAT